MNPADKRLAVMVPDHLADYIDFEGIIPRGSYGARLVVFWGSGTYEAVEPGDPMEQIEREKFASAPYKDTEAHMAGVLEG